MNGSGMFVDLKWDNIEKQHLEKWNILRTEYKVEPKVHSSESKDLNGIANRCIDQCSHLLFYCMSMLADQENFFPEDEQWLKAYVISPDELQSRLRQALCDHLIVTFTHRFYCDNTQAEEPDKAFKGYAQVLFDHTEHYSPNGKENDIETASEKSNRRNEFKKDLKEQYRKYQESVIKAESATADILDNVDCLHIEEEMHLPTNWQFSLCMASNYQGFPYRDIKEDFPLVKKTKGTRNILSRLTKYLNNTKYLSLIINEEQEVNRTRIWSPSIQYARNPTTDFLQLRRKDDLKFVALVATPQYQVKGKLTAFKYRVNEDFEIIIHPALQIALNNYLLELRFHGMALATAIQSNQVPVEEEIRPEIILAPMRLNASLIHAPFIHMLADKVMEKPYCKATLLFGVNHIISYWNAVALPVLEELFIWNVFEEYRNKGVKGAFNAIEESFFAKEYDRSRCDRLNIYRIVSPSKDGTIELFENLSEKGDQTYNQIYNIAVMNSLGFQYDLEKEKFVEANAYRNAFSKMYR